MHYTRRLLDRQHSSIFVLALCVAAGAVAASCSSADEAPSDQVDAGGSDAAPAVDPAQTGDASTGDVDAGPDSDAPLFDGGPRAVDCGEAPCATSLVTTRGANPADLGEGFCALLHDGTVACWGAGGAGQLGRGDEAGTADSATAEPVLGVHDAVSLDHTCAVDKTGATFCWGTGPFLRSTSASTTTEKTAVELEIPSATKVAIGFTTGCALTGDGVLCWGGNTYAQVAPLEMQPSSAVLAPKAVDLPSGAPVQNIAVGNAAFATRSDGSVVSWGANPPLARVSSLFPDPYPLPIALSSVTSLDATEDNACATSFGVGYCWGTTLPKSLGTKNDEPILVRALPMAVQTPEPIVQIATTRTVTTTNPPQPQRWCAVGASGDVYCSGSNAGGQAGDGTKDFAYHAVRVVGLPGPAAQVRTTPNATCALLTSGKVYCWGTNFYGQLGNGKIKTASTSPQEVVLP